MRYERKWVFEDAGLKELLAFVKLHPAHFKETYPERIVNNIYLDSAGFDNYYENEAGIGQRVKIRIRWYGKANAQSSQAKLEYKFKKGTVGWKETFSLPKFNTLNPLTFLNEELHLESVELPVRVKSDLRNLRPVFANAYQRKYFESGDRKFRLTIDYNIKNHSWHNITGVSCFETHSRKNFIVELKYDRQEDLAAKDLLRIFPTAFQRNSKFVNGIEEIYY